VTDHVQQQSDSIYTGACIQAPEGLLYPSGRIEIFGFSSLPFRD